MVKSLSYRSRFLFPGLLALFLWFNFAALPGHAQDYDHSPYPADQVELVTNQRHTSDAPQLSLDEVVTHSSARHSCSVSQNHIYDAILQFNNRQADVLFESLTLKYYAFQPPVFFWRTAIYSNNPSGDLPSIVLA
ncbi:MAG: hypothetical protein FH748_15220 [Balneolaceae bacterium]|nr:hypothetical protein [Balneolaceae bacterium]